MYIILSGETKQVSETLVRINGESAEKKIMSSIANLHLNVSSLLVLPKGQFAQKVEDSADLMGREVVHVVQDSLHQKLCSVNQAQ